MKSYWEVEPYIDCVDCAQRVKREDGVWRKLFPSGRLEVFCSLSCAEIWEKEGKLEDVDE